MPSHPYLCGEILVLSAGFDGQDARLNVTARDGCPTGCNLGGRTGIPAYGSSPTLSTGKMPVS
ncbi:MAG TPA: hypothetical protein VKZ59_07375, partial [Acidobacteriota bacterium]|nr:hypothetical protein [Acidobacteriota bacterium]